MLRGPELPIDRLVDDAEIARITMLENLDLRAIRSFVAVAEELHFTRAAARLFVAEQALSRDIRRLERTLGVTLFVRTTRRVRLTRDGQELLVEAQELIGLNDRIVRRLQGADRPIIVEVIGEGLTSSRVLNTARRNHPDLEFRGRHRGGLGAAINAILVGETDAAFGRAAGLGVPLPDELERHPVRLEPIGLLLPTDHPLAKGPVPMRALDGLEIDISQGNPWAPEWVDLGMQLMEYASARAQPAHPPAEGIEETVQHLARERLPILTHLEHPPVEGGIIRPLIEPTPLYQWSIVHPRGAQLSGLRALREAAAELARDDAWLERPERFWLPEPEASEGPPQPD
jgi:DNA-binding transcriptional LysR family regulator